MAENKVVTTIRGPWSNLFLKDMEGKGWKIDRKCKNNVTQMCKLYTITNRNQKRATCRPEFIKILFKFHILSGRAIEACMLTWLPKCAELDLETSGC